MRRLYILIGLATGLVSVPPALAKDDYVYGPPPDWAGYKAMGDAAVRAKLPDPDNWAVEWPNGYVKSGWRHKGRFVGYLSCGRLRAVTAINGGYPIINFVAIIDYDQVKTIDVSGRESNSLVNVMCNALVSRGLLAPAELMDRRLHDVEVSFLGLTIRPMPDGAYVSSVVPGSTAAAASLKPGMVISMVNAVPLAGLGDAMLKVIDAAGANASLTIVGGTTIKLDGIR